MNLTTARLLEYATPICNDYGLQPEDVANITLEPRAISITVYKRNADGKKYIDQAGEAAKMTITDAVALKR